MQDEPRAAEILPAIAKFLRETVTTDHSAHTMFQARVAANACDLAAREAQLAPASDAAERGQHRPLRGNHQAQPAPGTPCRTRKRRRATFAR